MTFRGGGSLAGWLVVLWVSGPIKKCRCDVSGVSWGLSWGHFGPVRVSSWASLGVICALLGPDGDHDVTMLDFASSGLRRVFVLVGFPEARMQLLTRA